MPAARHDHFDAPWKNAVRHELRGFLAFYFADQCAGIDWSRGWRFLDQELQQAARSDLPASVIADIVASVRLRSGAPCLLHIEIQCQRDAGLPRRIHLYNARLLDLLGTPVASLVLLGDHGAAWRPLHFTLSPLGTQTCTTFATAKLSSFADRLDWLLQQRNPFAIVTAAHLLARSTRNEPERRYQALLRLTTLLYQRRWSKRRMIDTFRVIHWLLYLPPAQAARFWRNILRLERRLDMECFTSLEQILLERGERKGMAKGIAAGEAKGRREGMASLLQHQLTQRFGPLPAATCKRLAKADLAQLTRWSETLLYAQSLQQVFRA